MRQKLSVDQGEEGVEGEDDAAQQARGTWGKGKRGYYGADTEEYEVCSNTLLILSHRLIQASLNMSMHSLSYTLHPKISCAVQLTLAWACIQASSHQLLNPNRMQHQKWQLVYYNQNLTPLATVAA